jgi:hypothetical protein
MRRLRMSRHMPTKEIDPDKGGAYKRNKTIDPEDLPVECEHRFETLDNEAPYGEDVCIYCGEKQPK